jgi:hypothetical protein
MTTNPKSNSWRDVLPIHPAAELFPMMSPDELRALGEDIKKHGLRDPVAVYREGARRFLLDGRNRLAAMEAVGIDPQFALTQDRISIRGDFPAPLEIKTDPYAYVISKNIARRHLTAEQRRELIAKLIKQTPGKSDRQIADEAKSNRTTVGQIRKQLEDRGDVSIIDTRTDRTGREQPAHKKDPHVAAAVERAVERSEAAKLKQAGGNNGVATNQQRKDAAPAVTVNSGPIEATDMLRRVPREKWHDLMLARRCYMQIHLTHACRCLIEFANDAKLMYEALGFASAEAMIRDGYGLKPEEIAIAVEWLKLNPPSTPIALDADIGLAPDLMAIPPFLRRAQP